MKLGEKLMKDMNEEKKSKAKNDKSKIEKIDKSKTEKEKINEDKEIRQKRRDMRKNNMRIFPIYKKLAWDYLFYYAIDFLFLTQAKGISASNIILANTFYSLFIIIMQIPASIIVEFLGKRNSLVFSNILNSIYFIMIMLSRNLGDLIFVYFISAVAFSIKSVSEPSLLNESIPPSRYKGEIYSKINGKGASGYYMLNSISKMISGILYTINAYIPMCCGLVVSIITVILSCRFIEPVKNKRSQTSQLYINQIKDIKVGFSFILKSERLKALILCAALLAAILSNLGNLYVDLYENLSISATVIGIIAAMESFISSYSSRKQKNIQERLKNKTLITIAMIISVTTIISGIFGIIGNKYIVFVAIIICMHLIYGFGKGLYHTIIDQYLSNFTNEKIDTKIYSANNLFSGIIKVISGLFVSFLLGRIEISYCMIIIGIVYTILYVFTGKYMKIRVGLKPEEYSKEEIKYDSLRIEK